MTIEKLTHLDCAATRFLSLICVVSVLGLGACTDAPSDILNKRALLERHDWWDNRDWEWYEANIPFFESPDADIDATYYYRWEVLTKHLVYGSPETGYTFTEFIDRPYWSGAYGAISCPLRHPAYEIRWLKNRRVIDDFAHYWFETPGAEPRSYSNWYGDAMWATYTVLGDRRFIEGVLPHMVTQYERWTREHFDPNHGMFSWVGAWDGMEYNINSRLTEDEFGGGEGYRPTLNSYMYADAMAISKAAALLGDGERSELFTDRAAALKSRVQEELWDPEREFFFHQFAMDERGGIHAKSLTYETGPHAGSPHGRELLGYVPWQFNLPDPGYEVAWKFLMDPEYFFAPFGPTTVERNDPQFLISPQCCWWSGNEWPYATTQTLVAMANLLNNYRQEVVSREDYFRLLKTYTLDHRMNGRPYVAEAANPDNGSWEGHNFFYHSEHYLHSAYVDLIVTGLVGLRPRDDNVVEVNPLVPDDWDYFALDDLFYHGHRLAVVWDRQGTRYGMGPGLTLLVDGREVARVPELGRVTGELPPGGGRQPQVDRSVNLAVNNGGRFYPWTTASYSHPSTPPHFAVDGNYWYHISPPNRWTTVGSENASDWIEVDFGIQRPVERIKLYFLDDGEGVRAPADYRVEAWNGSEWKEIAGQSRSPSAPTGHRANTIAFPETSSSRVRVVMTHRPGSASGLTELEVWSEATLPLPDPIAPIPNLAVARSSSTFRRPTVSASYTFSSDRIEQISDMAIAFTGYSRNRWTAYDSPNESDWVEVDLGEPRSVSGIDLYLYGDEGGVRAPRSYTVQHWDGVDWTNAQHQLRTPTRPAAWALNRVRFDAVRTDRIRVVFQHDLPAYTGVTELMIWED
jgi:hypothetical protein